MTTVDPLDAAHRRIAELEAQVAAEKTVAASPTDLVDTDFTPPLYEFAGANLAGQQVHSCMECGALVLGTTNTERHDDLHQRVYDLQRYNGRLG